MRTLDENRHYNILFFQFVLKKETQFSMGIYPLFQSKKQVSQVKPKKEVQIPVQVATEKKHSEKPILFYDFVIMSSAAIFYFYQNFTIL